MWRVLCLLALVAFSSVSGCLTCNKGYTDNDFKALGYRKWNQNMRSCFSYGYKGCYSGWHNTPCSGGCSSCGTTGCGLPTVYDFISSHSPFLKSLVDLAGLSTELNRPFDGTLFLPTDAALQDYISQFEFNVTDPRYTAFVGNFIRKLLSYHRLPRRLYAAQLVSGKFYPTFYRSANGMPHYLTFLSTNCGGCVNCGCTACAPCTSSCRDPKYRLYKNGKYSPKTVWGSRSKGKGGKKGGYQCLVNQIRDGQGNFVEFDKVDKFVFGGGVIHTVKEVLQPNDIFPSITAAVTSADAFDELVRAIQRVTAIDVLQLLETTPGNLAAPIDSAFAGINVGAIDPGYLLQVLAYHFCPVTSPVDLLLAPYTGPARNPCLTLLSSLAVWNEGLRYEQLRSPDFSGFPAKQINFVNANRRPDKTSILVADVSTPLHVIVAIDKVMLPPQNLPPAP